MNKPFLHELKDVSDLLNVVASEKKIIPSLVEKDYWIMHCLWGLQQQGFQFELKGGTSLSKGFGIIERFSEDLDIQIHPKKKLMTGPNHDKPTHIQARRDFFDELATTLDITGLSFSRDHEFDDLPKMRGAGIRGHYQSTTSQSKVIKNGILLEVGFDQTTPNEPRNITSWAFEKAGELGLDIIDNRAMNIHCYLPEYTFVEKLQTISTKFRKQQDNNELPKNFIRNYYDVYKLLNQKRVLDFIGTAEYTCHKEKRFRKSDEKVIAKNDAFNLASSETYMLYKNEYELKSDLYYGTQPSFDTVISEIKKNSEKL